MNLDQMLREAETEADADAKLMYKEAMAELMPDNVPIGGKVRKREETIMATLQEFQADPTSSKYFRKRLAYHLEREPSKREAGNKATKDVEARLSTIGGWVREDLEKPQFAPEPVPIGTVTQGFSDKHQGIDVAVDNAPIYAEEDGYMSFAGDDGSGSMTVEARTQTGRRPQYSHLAGRPIEDELGRSGIEFDDGMRIFQGDPITAGQVIGYTGNSGKSSGPHVHMEDRSKGPLAEDEGVGLNANFAGTI